MARYLFDIEVFILNHLPLPDNAVVFDVGCSYGEYTIALIEKMRDIPYTVHCFDPVSDFCEIQRREFGHHLNIHINNFGISDHKGDATFCRIKGNEAMEGCSSLCLRPEFVRDNWPYVLTQVKLDTLDNYIRDNDIRHIDLMKVDVEGNEYNVFKGGKEMFINETVDIIQFEYNSCLRDMGFFMADIIHYIDPFNYSLCDFIEGRFIKLTEFTDDWGHHNYFIINNRYFNEHRDL